MGKYDDLTTPQRVLFAQHLLDEATLVLKNMRTPAAIDLATTGAYLAGFQAAWTSSLRFIALCKLHGVIDPEAKPGPPVLQSVDRSTTPF